MNYPTWVTDPTVTQKVRDQRRIEFLIRRAASLHTPNANVPALAEAIGITPQALYAAMEKGSCTNQIAAAIELLVGRSNMPRELLCPEKTDL